MAKKSMIVKANRPQKYKELRNQAGNWKGGVYYGSSNRYNCRYVNKNS